MIPSLQNIADRIPPPSEMVRNRFNRSVTPDAVEYGNKARYFYAGAAIGISGINTLGYGLVILSRIYTAFIHRDFTDLTKNCHQDATHVFDSLYFSAAMSAYLFMSVLRSPGYELKLTIVPYNLRPESRAPALISSKGLEFTQPPKCEIPGSQFTFYADRNQLTREAVKSVNYLLKFLADQQDLVVVLSPDKKKAYLVSRDKQIHSQVMNGTLTFFDLSKEQFAPTGDSVLSNVF
jgi:hypothetical protein